MSLSRQQILGLSEDQFVALFSRQLQRCPVVRNKDFQAFWPFAEPSPRSKSRREVNSTRLNESLSAGSVPSIGHSGEGVVKPSFCLSDNLFQASVEELVKTLNLSELETLAEDLHHQS